VVVVAQGLFGMKGSWEARKKEGEQTKELRNEEG